MTIAIIHEIFFPITNGVLTSTIALAQALRARGHSVIFIAPAWKAFRASEVEGIPVEYLPSIPVGIYPGIRLTWPFSQRVVQMLQRHGVDVVQLTAQGTLSWSCLRAARRLGLPVVSTLHTLIFKDEYLRYASRLLWPLSTARLSPGHSSRPGPQPGARPLLRVLRQLRRRWLQRRTWGLLQRGAWTLVRWFLQHSDTVTAPSRYVCNLIEENCPGVEPLHVPNCVAVGCDSGAAECTSGPAEGKTFVYVGRLGQEKSVDLLLEGFYRAWRRDRRLRLVIVGDGPEADVYRRQAGRMDGAVRFTGRLVHRQLLESGLLQNARAVVTASTTENQPVSVLEAIGLGRPVIVPEVEGISELVEENGSLFSAGDAAALAGELLRMSEDEEFYEKCAAGARELARAGGYRAERLAEVYERLYLGLGTELEDSEAVREVRKQELLR